MSTNLIMGVNPRPTCVISLANYSISGDVLTANFNYTLSSMGGYDWWGYGVALEYGENNSLGQRINLISKNTNRWSAKSGSLSITKYGVTTTPQSFYFRLNSLYPTEGCPGNIGTYSIDVDVAKPSIILNCSDLIIENPFLVNYESYNNSFSHDLHVDINNEWFKGWYGYSSGTYVSFSDNEILAIYQKFGMPQAGFKTNVKFTLRTWSGNKEVGINSVFVEGLVGGTSKVLDRGIWKNCVPYYKDNQIWKPCISYCNDNGVWKRSNP